MNKYFPKKKKNEGHYFLSNPRTFFENTSHIIFKSLKPCTISELNSRFSHRTALFICLVVTDSGETDCVGTSSSVLIVIQILARISKFEIGEFHIHTGKPTYNIMILRASFFYVHSQNCEWRLLVSSCLSIHVSFCPHGTTRLLLDGCS